MRRGILVVAGLALLFALPTSTRAAVPDARGPGAIALFTQAEESYAALRANTQAQRQRQNFTRVLDAYRRVFEKFPATRQGEASLMRAGELLTLQFRWTGQEGDLNRAQNYYQRLVQTSPKSPLVDDALLAIAYLALDQFKDPAQAWLRFRDVTQLAPGGDKVAEAKRQLKRLAGYAVAEKPAPPAGTAELSCPVPTQPMAPGLGRRDAGPGVPAALTSVSAAPPPVISAAASPVIAMPAPAVITMPQTNGMPTPRPASVPTATGTVAAPNRVRDIRHWSNPEYSRVVIDLDQKTNFYSNLLEDRTGSGKPPRLYIDLFASHVEERFCKPISVNDGILNGIRAGQYTPDSVRVVLEIDGLRTYRVFPMQNPFRIVVDITGGAPVAAAAQRPRSAAVQDAPSASSAVTAGVTASTEPPPETSEQPAQAPSPALNARLTPSAPSSRYAPQPVPDLIPLPAFTASGTHPQPAPDASTPLATPLPASPATFSGAAAGPAPGAPSSAALAPARPHRPVPGGAAPGAPAPPPGKPSLARQLGLGVRRVIIDAGHGAHDPGAIGVGGLQEKDVTLDLALRVRDILQAAGYETVLTRDRDVYLPLEERTALANTARGDLFLSLHCNSSDSGNLSGVETYFLNLASSVRAMQTAARENSMAIANMSDLQQIVREIQNSKMDESSQFASRVQRSMHDALHRKYPDTKNLGVKQAPFYVLIGAQMPSVLAEVSFINNTVEGRRLADPTYRQLIAQALVDGVKRYVRTVKTASLALPGKPTP